MVFDDLMNTACAFERAAGIKPDRFTCSVDTLCDIWNQAGTRWDIHREDVMQGLTTYQIEGMVWRMPKDDMPRGHTFVWRDE